MTRWAFTFAKWRGVPLRIHASTILGLYVFSGFQFVPMLWLLSLGLVLLHELGHAAVVLRVGATPVEIMLTGFGGHCAWQGHVRPVDRAAIAFGGVAAQLLLFAIVQAVAFLGLWPHGTFAAQAWWMFTTSNLWLVVLNLLPFKPLDGVEAWALPYLWGQAARERLTKRRFRDAKGRTDVGLDAEAQAARVAAELLENARREPPP